MEWLARRQLKPCSCSKSQLSYGDLTNFTCLTVESKDPFKNHIKKSGTKNLPKFTICNNCVMNASHFCFTEHWSVFDWCPFQIQFKKLCSYAALAIKKSFLSASLIANWCKQKSMWSMKSTQNLSQCSTLEVPMFRQAWHCLIICFLLKTHFNPHPSGKDRFFLAKNQQFKSSFVLSKMFFWSMLSTHLVQKNSFVCVFLKWTTRHSIFH